MPPRIHPLLSLCAATALAVAVAAPSAPAAADDDAASAPAADPTAAEVETFLNERVPELLKENEVPGAAVSVVDGGQRVYAGGYGDADAAEGTPVDPAETSFPMASVSKSFTATAVMQLAESGEVDLDTDVNEYLPGGAQLPDTYPGDPVTLHHLLTHTAGFEESVVGMATDSAETMLPLKGYLSTYQPERVHPPGRFVSYSNYGTSLVGLVVQEVSGVPFADYLDENVFGPLGMEHSGFMPPDQAAERFTVPTLHGATPETVSEPLFVNQSPAGAGYATATDMSDFMLAMLGDGAYDGARVLSAESTQAMLTKQESLHPGVAGAGYGTWDKSRQGPRTVGHSGDLHGAHTEWAVVPELGFGVYVAVNGDGTSANPLKDARAQILDAVLDEFAGPDTASGGAGVADDGSDQAASAADGPLDRYAGTYVSTRNSENDASAALEVQDQTSVSVTGAGTLHTSNSYLGETDWTSVEPGLFVSDGGERLAFDEAGGEVIGLSFGSLAPQAYEKVAWYDAPNLRFAGAGAALLVMCSLLAWPVIALVRRIRGTSRQRSAGTRTAAALAAAALAICAGYLGFLITLLGDSDLLENLLFTGSPLLTLPLTAAGLVAVAMVVAAALSWFRRWWNLAGRIHYTLVTLALCQFVNVAAAYNLVWLPPAA
ncbi:serine hydrolase domain-containing protein [Streptomonospora salina]|uniref:CubicO group peptidase (Beta-lactamase class C family) n=1 Tax=Streptomonospora salina TaxID=104205 RepID=A0A841E2C6_9ACTN|nr:serine hydrolase domain-containing protein [Streptomonospora salina]MBB5997957.1 CubicO group peptidase (beta-lactamase class C family) [Streptomonospora salina]